MDWALGRLLHRPVAVTAGCLLALGLAGIAAARLPVALLPPLTYPALAVWTAYPGVIPEVVERAVTQPAEEALAGTAGVERITSRSQLGGSLVRLDFTWSTDLDLASLAVREELERLAPMLPSGARRPLVLHVDPSQRPVMVVALSAAPRGRRTGDDESVRRLVELKQVARDVVARRLEQLDGVARVRLSGGWDREITVEVSADRLDAHGIALDQIESALRAANVTLAGGSVRRGPFRYAIQVDGELRGARDVGDLVVTGPGDPPVHLREVAQVADGLAERRGLVRLDGREVLLLLVERRPDANSVETAAACRRALAGLRSELAGVRLDVVLDESTFIRSTMAGVAWAVCGGGLLAAAILLLFLRRPRPLAAVVLSLPLSLALALILFEAFGVSLNLLSLSGLALGVGLLVDNSIVVVENVVRLRELGSDAMTAARRGAAEVAPAIAASTLTTCAVFLPLTLVEGLAGRLFRDQSMAVVCSLCASLLVAVTVVPLVLSRDRSASGPRTGAASGAEPLASSISGSGPSPRWLTAYEAVLTRCLRHPRAVLWTILGAVALIGLVAWRLPRQLVPSSGEGHIDVRMTLAAEASLPLLAENATRLERTLTASPGVSTVLSDLGERDDARLDLDPRPPYAGDLTVVLEDGTDPAQVLAALAAARLPTDVSVHARPARTRLETLLLRSDSDLVIDLIADRREAAQAAAARVLEGLRAQPDLANVAPADAEDLPAYRLTLDRDALLRFGAEPETLGRYLEAAAGGREATRLITQGDDVPVVLHGRELTSIDRLLAERVPVRAGLLPVGLFVHAEAVRLPAVLLRGGQASVVRLGADLAPGADLRTGTSAVERILSQTLPAGVRGRVSGANESFRSSLSGVGWSLLLSVALIYLILAAQFESLRQPVVVLIAVPLSAIGVVLALAVTGEGWSLMSLTGCVVLVGIAVNDGIVKIDFINRRRSEGLDLRTAVLEAGRERARPIVMTSLTTAFGLLPLAVGIGAGGSLQAPLAIAIIGGLASATVLTLVVVPVLYEAIEPATARSSSPTRGAVSDSGASEP